MAPWTEQELKSEKEQAALVKELALGIEEELAQASQEKELALRKMELELPVLSSLVVVVELEAKQALERALGKEQGSLEWGLSCLQLETPR